MNSSGLCTAPVLLSDRPSLHAGNSDYLFHQLFEHSCDKLGWRQVRNKIAVEYPHEKYSYKELDRFANRIAGYLQVHGANTGDVIGLLVDRSIYSFAAVLAISKLGAVFVPLDTRFPADRIDFILEDSGASMIVTLSEFMPLFEECVLPKHSLDASHDAIESHSTRRKVRSGVSDQDVCYIIYTSGTTGKPKGVAISHANICNFLIVANECYGYQTDHRVYQALTLAFDYSIEEIWLPLLAGATLVPAPSEGNLVGDELHHFLHSRNISAMCCVPTLLATIDGELPDLRFLMVSGEACPQLLLNRWCRPGMRFLNTYGPTETTVSATWHTLEPGTTVTIGGPLNSYSIVILDPDGCSPLPIGKSGEICIGGPGLANGYLNRPEETAKAFIDDFIGLPDNTSKTIYRTGDLGRINENCEIEYLGRIDTQVKIRGYRIELSEIESVIMNLPFVSQAVVTTTEPEPGNKELVAYLTHKTNTDSSVNETVTAELIQKTLRSQLPAYMVPAFFETLDSIPVLPSGKADRKSLPAPTAQRLLLSGDLYIEPSAGVETDLATLLAGLLKQDRISADAHFFDQLGGNSLLMARFVTQIRKKLGIKGVSLKILYEHPTINQLAVIANTKLPADYHIKVDNPVCSSEAQTFDAIDKRIDIDEIESTVNTTLSAVPESIQPIAAAESVQQESIHRWKANTAERIICGSLQILSYLVLTFTFCLVNTIGYHWIGDAAGLFSTYIRTSIFTTLLFTGTSLTLITIKWLAIGRFKAEDIRIWSLRYVRFWLAKTVIRINPLNLTRGTWIYNWYLRLLGAKVGQRSTLFSVAPTACDLINIGANTLIREDVSIAGYSADNGFIRIRGVTIGSNTYIGPACVLDIDTTIGNNAQLGTSSALFSGQRVPDDNIFQGSPAVESSTNYIRSEPATVSDIKRFAYGLGLLSNHLVLTLPITILLILYVAGIGHSEARSTTTTTLQQLPTIATYTGLVYFSFIILALFTVLTVPRILHRQIIPTSTHALFGYQYFLTQLMNRFSNSRLLNVIFGDSSMILHYLSAIGFDMSESSQTGSNFGVSQRHNSPFLCKIGRNTLVSDRLRLMNIDMSSTSFKISQITMPHDTYLGNVLYYPVGSRIGENCLIATKAAIPTDGHLRTGVGILGSPSFEIPRSVASDHKFDHYKEPAILANRLKMKFKSNLITLILYFTKNWSQWFLLVVIALLIAETMHRNEGGIFYAAIVLTTIATVQIITTILYSIFWEHLAQSFRKLRPQYCSLYDRKFWNHERFWKLNSSLPLEIFNGTPVKPVFQRLRGVVIGQNMFDNGTGLIEPGLIEIGDNCCFNQQSALQSHSLEDGTFKSDFISIGNNCNIGVGAFVHYGARIDHNSSLASDSFLMKGSLVDQDTHWGGNPAKEIITDPNLAVQLKTSPQISPGTAISKRRLRKSYDTAVPTKTGTTNN